MLFSVLLYYISFKSFKLEITGITGNEVIPIQCDIRDAIAVTSAVDACVDKVRYTNNIETK